jgi:hypothetical protein
MPVWGHGRNVAQRRREREAFYAPSRRQIDAVWGWNGNSAAKVVHFCYQGLVVSAIACLQHLSVESPTCADTTAARWWS